MDSHQGNPKFLENTLLLLTAVLGHAPLYYQLPRWANGLDPTFVHPKWIAASPCPFVLHMAKIHPIVWIAITALVLLRICHNYRWKLEVWNETQN